MDPLECDENHLVSVRKTSTNFNYQGGNIVVSKAVAEVSRIKIDKDFISAFEHDMLWTFPLTILVYVSSLVARLFFCVSKNVCFNK